MKHDEVDQLSLPTKVLSPQARAGLDVARAVSALYVVAHHVIGHSDAGGLLKTLFSAGQEAVIVFFLLSGFVIYVNEESRAAKPMGYFLRRLRRIYPPIFIAMAVSTVLWGLGLIQGSPSVASALATLFSLQDINFLKPGVISDPYLGNDPLWSLSYEVAFYAAFPLVMVFWRRSPLATRWGIAAATTTAFAGYLLFPNHFALVASYFALWWVGAMAGRLYLQGNLSPKALGIELAGLTVLTLLALVAVIADGYEGLGYFPFLMVRHFVVGLFLALLLCTRLRSALGRLCLTVASPAAKVAAVSYGLYVLHYPLLVQTGAWGEAWFVAAVVLLLALAVIADVVVPRVLPRAPRT